MRIVEKIPEALRPEVGAALAGLEAEQGRHFFHRAFQSVES